jgi:AraC-like DNA-binding protein
MIRYSEKWNQCPVENPQALAFLQVLLEVLEGEVTKALPACLPSTRHEKLARVVDYLQEHLPEKISIRQLAGHFGFSVRSLTRLFSQQLGNFFSSYCCIAFIMKTLIFIESGGDNVSELASRVGYESLSSFSNNFLQVCGKRPLEFIREKRR